MIVPELIGFAGKMGSGKTMLARHLCNFINYSQLDVTYSVMSFADPLRELVSTIILENIKAYKNCDSVFVDFKTRNVIYINVFNYLKNNKINVNGNILSNFWDKLSYAQTFDQVYRILLQYIGTDIYRNCVSEDYWVEQIKKRVEGKYVIFDDVRFINECNFILERGGVVIFLEADELYNVYNDKHISENSLPVENCSFVFKNDRSIGLNELIRNLCDCIHNFLTCKKQD